jgi:hypothetical protein
VLFKVNILRDTSQNTRKNYENSYSVTINNVVGPHVSEKIIFVFAEIRVSDRPVLPDE